MQKHFNTTTKLRKEFSAGKLLSLKFRFIFLEIGDPQSENESDELPLEILFQCNEVVIAAQHKYHNCHCCNVC